MESPIKGEKLRGKIKQLRGKIKQLRGKIKQGAK
jgi:uncharacterized protein YjbJ (UPF0337 family)